MTNAEYAQGLRQIAAWYEGHPDAPRPALKLEVFALAGSPENIASVIRALGGVKKEYNESFIWLTRDFGGVELKFYVARSAVCTKRVVSVQHIPEQVVPARDVEVIEWDCKPILSGDGDV